MHLVSRATLAAALVVLLSLAGCSDGSTAEKSPAGAASPSVAPGMDETLRASALALIEEREAALVDGDRESSATRAS